MKNKTRNKAMPAMTFVSESGRLTKIKRRALDEVYGMLLSARVVEASAEAEGEDRVLPPPGERPRRPAPTAVCLALVSGR